jgi:glycosyltransferase involved in cell wall biosynthesis
MIATNPLVSVLMTAYNREKYIAEAIESVLASTYQNFELIIVDDGSKDETVIIAKKYEEQDGRVKVYINEKNLGDYPNRNKAASYATGKYLKYVDADDRIYPHGLEILVKMMEQFPDAGWGLCSLEQDKEKAFPFMLSPTEAYLYHYTGPGLFHKAPLSAIIKRNVFEDQNGFRNIRMAGDFEMWHRLGLSYPVVLMPHGIVWYREHGDQEIKDYNKYIEVYEKIKVDYLVHEKLPLDKNTVKNIFKIQRKKKIRELFRSFFSLNARSIKASFIKLRYTN